MDQDDSSLLDVFLESQEVEKSLRARRIDVSTLFFWSQVPQMLLSRDIRRKVLRELAHRCDEIQLIYLQISQYISGNPTRP